MHRLVVDIETAPNQVHTWGLYDQNVGLSQLIKPSYMLCWGARWVGEKKVRFKDIRDPEMVAEIYELIDSADALIHFNGDRFDLPILHREFLLAGFDPPSPYKNIDLLKVAKKKFRFASNKLEHIAQQLGIELKLQTSGHQLWIKCMENDPAGWREMTKYNKQDIVVTEDLYNRFLPWIDQHPNHQLYTDIDSCPRCGAIGSLTRQGYAYTSLGSFQRYRCGSCRSWSRSGKRLAGTEQQVAL